MVTLEYIYNVMKLLVSLLAYIFVLLWLTVIFAFGDCQKLFSG